MCCGVHCCLWGRKSQTKPSSYPQPMAIVTSTVLGLIQNLRAFGGILVVSSGRVGSVSSKWHVSGLSSLW